MVSDNGASGEGGPNGTFNEWRFFNAAPTPTELSFQHIDELGSPASYKACSAPSATDCASGATTPPP